MIEAFLGDSGRVTWLKNLSWKKRIGLGAGAGFFLFVLFLGVGYAVTSVPEPNKVALEQATKVLYADGQVMGRIGLNRTIVPLGEISKDAQHAVLAAEDRNFYSEPGISPKGIGRALFSNIQAGGVSEGGSTITQQYAKNAFLTQDRTISRKVKEVFIALKMSRSVSKDKILEDYLNTIYFGRGAYGIQAASKTYFGVDAKDLTVAQSAVLASSIKSPAGLDPTKHPERAKERFAYVLKGMVDSKWLSAGDRDATQYPAIRQPGSVRDFPGSLDRVRQQVLDDLGRQGFPEDRITAGGLTVQTTILQRAQNAAIAAVEAKVPPATGDNVPVAALVSVEPGTGKVIAYYGGATPGGFDYANDGKGVQPGSSMKPYVLAAALEKGMSVDDKLDGSSPQEICGTTISNDEGDPPFGRIDLAKALQFSANTVYYRLACEVGAQRVADAAHAAGIPDSQPLADDVSNKPTAQIALGAGGYEIHPLDQAVGYATFAADGQRARPYFVQRVLDNRGNEIYKAKADTGKAFSEGIAADVIFAMKKVVAGGTGTNAQLADGRPVAGKTGTTGNNANAWFAGITPQLSTTVWVGMSKGGRIEGLPGVTGGVYGGQTPAKVFKDFMDTALAGAPVKDFPGKAGVNGGGSDGGSTRAPSPTDTGTPTPSVTPSVEVTVPPVLPSDQPTSSPSAAPTSSPTAAPTQSPAPQPTSSPPPTAAPQQTPAAGANSQASPAPSPAASP